MELKNFFTQNRRGEIIPGATVYVYQPGTTIAVNIYNADTSPKSNPFITGEDGRVQFRVANGSYDVRVVAADGEYTQPISAFDFNDARVSTESGSSQRLVEALDDRVEKGRIGNEELTTSTGTQPVAGALDSRFPVINVKHYGATGLREDDALPAIKAAIAAAPEDGATILFPNGHYYTPRADVTDISSWVLVEKSNIRFIAESRHGAVLENLIFLTRGSYGGKYRLSQDLLAGSKDINLATASTLSQNSYVQFISAINPYSTDAGEWQNGSANPTNLGRAETAFTEIRRVAKMASTSSFTLYDEIFFPMYRVSNEGQNFPIPGIDGAYVRELAVVENVTFEGLVLKREEGSSFRGVYFSRTVNCGLEDCLFLTNTGNPGRHILTGESLGFHLRRCTEFRNPENQSGSSWNSILIGGGSQDTTITECRLMGGGQIIDVTPGFDSNLLFGETPDLGPEGMQLTCLTTKMNACTISGAGDAFTTHPATYDTILTGNSILTGSTGFRIRSRLNTILGNVIYTRRGGIALSSFHDDTLIEGNVIKQIPDPDNLFWNGISVTPLSSEVMNNNNSRNIIISGNVITASEGTMTRHGIQFRNANNGAPSNPEFPDYTDNIKTGLSAYNVENNQFRNCGVQVNRFINGIDVENNSFYGTTNNDNWIEFSDDTAACRAARNTFYNLPATNINIYFGSSSSLSYGYDSRHVEGINELLAGGTVAGDNILTAFNTGLRRQTNDGLTLSNGSEVKTIRSVGSSSLYLRAECIDGVSQASVHINNQPDGNTNNRTYFNGRSIMQGVVVFNPDNTYPLGSASARPTEIFAANGTINTSDAREKAKQRKTSEAEKRVAAALKLGGQFYKWISAVEKKGEEARWHYGWMAQEVVAAFETEGLDAYSYGMLCYDEWEEDPEVADEETGEIIQENRPSGNRYGLRMDQLLAFIVCNT